MSQLLALAKQIPELHRDAGLRQTIRNCAYTRSLKAGSQLTAAAAAGAIGVAAVATAGLSLVPTAAITAAGAAASAGAGQGATQAFKRIGNLAEGIDRAAMAARLLDRAEQDLAEDGDEADQFAIRALEILRFSREALTALPAFPDDDSRDENPDYKAAVQTIEGLL